MASADRISRSTIAVAVPATVNSPYRGPYATLFATISATLGPGISINTVTAAMKASRTWRSIIGLSSRDPHGNGSSFRSMTTKPHPATVDSVRVWAARELTQINASILPRAIQSVPLGGVSVAWSVTLPAAGKHFGHAACIFVRPGDAADVRHIMVPSFN